MKEKYIAAVDFGSSKTSLAVVRVEGSNATLLYYRTKDSGTSVRYSAIANATKVSENIGELVSDAENSLGIQITYLITSYPKYYIRSESNRGKIVRTNPEEGIIKDEIEGLKNDAMYEYPLENTDSEIVVGAVAQSFNTEYDLNISESNIVGMDGATLEGNFSIFVGKKADSYRIDNAIKKAGINLVDKFFSPALIADAVLSDNEKKTGVALVDIGGGSTSVTIFCDEVLRHYASIPFGGKSVTRDIASECGIEEELAEEIKLQYGGCMISRMQNLAEKTLRINYAGTWKEVGVPYLTEIITYRMQEIIEAICYEIERSGYADKLQNGIVITGGGANLLNICDFFKDISGYETKRGFDRNIRVNFCDEKWFGDLGCCTLWGLLNYAIAEDLGFLAEVDPAVVEANRKAREKAEKERKEAVRRAREEAAKAAAEKIAAEALKAAGLTDEENVTMPAEETVAEPVVEEIAEEPAVEEVTPSKPVEVIQEKPVEKPIEKPVEKPIETEPVKPVENKKPVEANNEKGFLFDPNEYEDPNVSRKKKKTKKPGVMTAWVERIRGTLDDFQTKAENIFDPKNV